MLPIAGYSQQARVVDVSGSFIHSLPSFAFDNAPTIPETYFSSFFPTLFLRHGYNDPGVSSRFLQTVPIPQALAIAENMRATTLRSDKADLPATRRKISSRLFKNASMVADQFAEAVQFVEAVSIDGLERLDVLSHVSLTSGIGYKTSVHPSCSSSGFNLLLKAFSHPITPLSNLAHKPHHSRCPFQLKSCQSPHSDSVSAIMPLTFLMTSLLFSVLYCIALGLSSVEDPVTGSVKARRGYY